MLTRTQTMLAAFGVASAVTIGVLAAPEPASAKTSVCNPGCEARAAFKSKKDDMLIVRDKRKDGLSAVAEFQLFDRRLGEWLGAGRALYWNSRGYTVVCPDLRGYGDSDKPSGGDDHAAYSKRSMAADQLEVMRRLGFDRFAVVGHDRGARVGLRMALDHPASVSRLAVLDIIPTKTIYDHLDRDRATTVWRYLFLVQPPDLPERLIGADPGFYLRWTFDEWSGSPDGIEPEARAEYERCFDTASIHATCEDYRAGSTIDLDHDAADVDTPIACPVLALWSEDGLGRHWDLLDVWRRRAPDVRGRPLDCGHFLPEEPPDEVSAELLAFLG